MTRVARSRWFRGVIILLAAALVALEAAALLVRTSSTVGPGGCCSPRIRVPFNSRIEGSKCAG